MTSSASKLCWPSPEQELLLKAALLKDEQALRAWSELKARTDPSGLDPGSLRLLPLLWHNLGRRKGMEEDASLEAAYASYRGTLAENTFLMHHARSFLEELRSAGCPAMLLKGLALVEGFYVHRGLRPMGDFDILVPEERREEVVSLLQDAGWKPMSRGRERFTRPYREVVHAHAFSRGSGSSVDLHWHAMEECVWPGADDDFWSGSEKIDFEGVPVAIMNAADQLLHICVHGTKWEAIPTLRWVADADAVIGAAGSALDWDRLAEQAARRNLTLPVKAGLEYLRKLLDAPVPGEVLERLGSIPVPRRELREFRRRTKEQSGRPLSFLPTLWYKHSRMGGDARFLRQAWGFLPFIRKYWGLESLGELLLFAAKTALKKGRRVRRN
jgi:hypothetical protein